MTVNIEWGSSAQQGWQCPVCKTVMAPSMVTCIKGDHQVRTKQGTNTFPDPPLPGTTTGAPITQNPIRITS